MKNQGYKEIAICGLDECGCVGATAKGAVKTGANVVMIENCIGRRFPDAKVRKMRDELKALGVKHKDIVSIMMPNTPEAIIAFYAIKKQRIICYR